ncbi:MAG: PocR ligand-binding domain-containing protein, partial [Planctomycetes bacterium]|nr:PocR ligand-binding domain-containing protein [Planctomycetota bacterium]
MKGTVNDGRVLRLRNYIGEEFLSLVQKSYTYLLKTCTIIYDVDGNHASKLISSPYCSFLRVASERKDMCETYCWEISRGAICNKEVHEAECPGGLVVFSCPIFYGDTVIGVNSAAVSNPPKSRFKIYDVALDFKVDPAILLSISRKSATSHKYILENIREQLIISTDVISKLFKVAYQ